MLELQEQNFIREGYSQNPYPFRFWSILVTLFMLGVYAGTYQANQTLSDQFRHNPFLQVTNRQFSLFLWQHPQYMRVHAKNKIGYLTGFQYLHKINMELKFSEEPVVIPPDTLFLYHTWKRLLKSYLPIRAISHLEFKEFLNALEEWQPKNWPMAPKEYVKLIEGLEYFKNTHLESELPFDVKQAFYGWKNYFKEGEVINAFNPTFWEMETFLKAYPNYARNFWQNIVRESHPNYLLSFSRGGYDKTANIPQNEIAPFLRVAIYNHTHP